MNETKKLNRKNRTQETCPYITVQGYCPGHTGKIITMEDIAHLLDLSVSTVSRALGGSPRVGKNTLKKVQQAAKELFYVINTDASNLRKMEPRAMDCDKKPVTIYDVAKALSISTSTVSRSFFAHGGVNPVTKANVLQMAKEMGYTPHQPAKRLRQNKKVCHSCANDSAIEKLSCR
jgi:transcriptional regulator with XRE-family HTH domain